jgi:hypothetical protein
VGKVVGRVMVAEEAGLEVVGTVVVELAC